MTATTASISLRERLRRCEILKYSCSTRSPLSSPPGQDESRQAHEPKPVSTPAPARLSPDPALTAFAQLAAWRLNCRRAFISLVDTTIQHVLAEATRTISLYDISLHGPGDELSLGVQTLTCDVGICPITMAAFVGGRDAWIDSDISFADDTQFVISDLMAEPRTMNLPFLVGNTEYRYYVEVPLKSPNGLIIGSLCAIDNQPRSRFVPTDVPALQDIARLTTSHLELVRLKEDCMRAERLMQGLGHFNQGQSSISQWVLENPGQRLKADEENHLNQFVDHSQIPLTFNEFPGVDRPTRPSVVSDSLVTPSTQPAEYFAPRTEVSSVTTNSLPMDTSDAQSGAWLSPAPEPETTSTISPQTPDELPLPNLVEDLDAQQDDIGSSQVSINVRGAFSRASNLIRESMDLEATCFLEISSDGRFRHNGRRRVGKSRQRTAADGLISDDMSSSSATHTNESDASSAGSAQDSNDTKPAAKRCQRLGFSTRYKSSVASSSMTKKALTVPESLLSKLAHRYPAGHIFKFDSYGIITSGEDTQKSQDSSSSKKGRVVSRRKLADMLCQYFPNARSLIFMPLYDNEKQHLYAGFVGWTTDSTRVLQPNEMVYISGFANSIMCEVMRLETLVLDKAKSDFMSSMSHELRSPLHGILAATQLMQESSLSPAQEELATMVDTCGRTLLDIMNNLLDHAKINHFTDAKNKILPRKSKSTKNSQQEVYNLVAQIDLATVVEETVASVAAGHSVREQRMDQISSRRRKSPSRASKDAILCSQKSSEQQTCSRPSVIVDIQHRDNWVFETEAGSWRRIVMNLVGNALKYTEAGYVHVGLETTTGAASKHRPTEQCVILTVSDTGQGISENYLKHRLFSPFAQEDNLSVGAGLGLSIVSQIVSSLHGQIRIESEVGTGTKVTVEIPLASVPNRPSLARTESDAIFKPLRELTRTNGTVCFVGFDIYPALDSTPSGMMSKQASTMLKLKQSLVEVVTRWYGFQVVSNADESAILIIEEFHAARLLSQDPGSSMFTKKHIIVGAYGLGGSSTNVWDGHSNYLAAPVGPMKFARILKTVFHKESPPGADVREESRDAQSSMCADTTDKNARIPFKHLGHMPTRTPSPAPSISQSTTLSKVQRVLLVDDNDINLRILASLVRKLNVLYVTAVNGQEALDRYIASVEHNMPIGYVFMDISMPVMDGLTSTRRIRAYERDTRIASPTKIITLTGLASAQAQKEALASGVDLFFRKPVKMSILRDLLAKDKEELAQTNENLSDDEKKVKHVISN